MLRLLVRNPVYTRFWLGFTLSMMGDAMTRVALTWYVLERTHTAAALAILTVMYTAPILAGGLVSGLLLDRFGPRLIMVVDNSIRGAAVALLALLALFGRLELWHVYAFAALYGLLMMVSLAGSPTLIPLLVAAEDLDAANALETVSFTVSGVVGAPLAGFLLAGAGLPVTIALDAVTYLLFAGILTGLRRAGDEPTAPAPRAGLAGAVRLLLGHPVLLATTLMFLAFNIGGGVLGVALPLHANGMAPGRPQTYGVLLGVLAVGEVLGAWLAGMWRPRLAVGARIALSQTIAGATLLLAAALPVPVTTSVGLALMGFFSAPLTIWAQTLRMRIIPPEARGRTFALLRTLMQGGAPLGGALAGLLLPPLGLPLTLVVTVLLMSLPGLAGLLVRDLRRAGADEGQTGDARH